MNTIITRHCHVQRQALSNFPEISNTDNKNDRISKKLLFLARIHLPQG